MKRGLKIAGIGVGVVLTALLGAAGYVEATYERDFSDVPLPAIAASQDPEVIRRGEYLVHAVAHCSACHGPAEQVGQHKLGEPHDLRGGFAMEAGPFGTFYPNNLTSHPETGIGELSDGELARAIRHGVDRHGRLAAFMSFAVGAMSDEDLTAIVSYLRTLPPIENPTPPDEWGFVAKALSRSFDPHDEPVPAHVPEGGVSVERGRYLANGPALCYGCHTPRDPLQGFAPSGALFSGEAEAEPDPFDAGYELVSPNLTPDPETGVMATWSEEQFVARFRTGRTHAGSKMPWESFARMTEDDLKSLYRYLRTLPPTHHDVGPSRREAGWKPSSG